MTKEEIIKQHYKELSEKGRTVFLKRFKTKKEMSEHFRQLSLKRWNVDNKG